MDTDAEHRPGRTTAEGQRTILHNALGIALAVGAYGLSYGALAVSAGLSPWQTQALSLLMYGGSSQLALVGVLASGGTGVSAGAIAALLGVRNLFYGASLVRLLRPHRRELIPMAHVLSDESAAMAVAQPSPSRARFAYWTTGAAVFLCWNAATAIGALAGSLLQDPRALGLDTVSSAAFLALVAPRLRESANRIVFVLAAAVAVGSSLFAGAGLPVLLAAVTALSVLLLPSTAAPGAPGTAASGPRPRGANTKRGDRV